MDTYCVRDMRQVGLEHSRGKEVEGILNEYAGSAALTKVINLMAASMLRSRLSAMWRYCLWSLWFKMRAKKVVRSTLLSRPGGEDSEQEKAMPSQQILMMMEGNYAYRQGKHRDIVCDSHGRFLIVHAIDCVCVLELCMQAEEKKVNASQPKVF